MKKFQVNNFEDIKNFCENFEEIVRSLENDLKNVTEIWKILMKFYRTFKKKLRFLKLVTIFLLIAKKSL